MTTTPARMAEELQAYGALPSQIVDVNSERESRVLSYLDLRADAPGWRRPMVLENSGRPCVHIFDGRDGVNEQQEARWCWRIALRGDGAWVGILEPGRLRILRAEVKRHEVRPILAVAAERGRCVLPQFLSDVGAGQDDIARRRYLTKLLDESAMQATSLGLSQIDALSLVGRGLFWRFLVDRGLLAGMEPGDICDGADTWTQCLDTKTHALRTFTWLNDIFNGGLLPFETPAREFKAEVFSSVLGNIAHGATESGQLRLPTEWREVNFSYIPVGLLSEVYQAFARHIDAEQAARRSIHYTPAHLVDFVVSQAIAHLPTGGRPRVLDPATGAGVFLVTAFRKLVEREWQETGARPTRQRVREILHHQLTGFDMDMRALRLAELALYLTALELDPEPQPIEDLRFEHLRQNVLFEMSEDQHGSLGPVEDRFKGRFDLVVGNPPWTAESKGSAKKAQWVKHTLGVVQERLGDEAASGFDFPDMNVDLPFLWRSMEWARERGGIALFTHARWLFGISDRAIQARNELLRALNVTGILNGSALRDTNVWPSVGAPWCVVFAMNEVPRSAEHAAFHFISPTLEAEKGSLQSRLRIDWLDATAVRTADVISRPWTLKALFKGNRLAIRSLEAMQRAGQPLGVYLERIGTRLSNGYQIGGKEGTQQSAAHMRGMFNAKGNAGLRFVVDVESLPRFNSKTLLRTRAPSIYKAPLLLLRRAIPADRSEAYTHFVDKDVAYDAMLNGISFAGLAEGEQVARYLQLVFQSSAYVFHEMLVDPQYGMFVGAMYLESVLKLPVVPFDMLSTQQRRKAADLSRRLSRGLTDELLREIDVFVFSSFALTSVDREAIWDAIDTVLPSTEARKRAVSPTAEDERRQFVDTLRDSLSRIVAASGLQAEVRQRNDLRWSPWLVFEVCVSSGRPLPAVIPSLRAFLEEANVNGSSLVTVRASSTTWFAGMLDQYALWTKTRARILASDLIAERSSQ